MDEVNTKPEAGEQQENPTVDNNNNDKDDINDDSIDVEESDPKSDNYFTKKRNKAASAIQEQYRTSKGERDYEKIIRNEEAEEKRRALRLARIRDRELELQVLKGLPADKVEEWINNQRKNASRKIQRFYRENKDGKEAYSGKYNAGKFGRGRMSQTGPIANERLRVKTAVMRAEQLLEQGIDEEFAEEMEDSKYFIAPEPAEPGAIRLANLQHRIQVKARERLEEREDEKEQQRLKMLTSSGTYSRSKKNVPAKGSAQHRYQRLLEVRHQAKIKLNERNQKINSGEHDYRRKERLMLLQRNKELIERLSNPIPLDKVKPLGNTDEEVFRRRKKNNMRNDLLEQEDEDPAMKKFPLPKGIRLEQARQRHETTLQAMEPEKAWWQVMRGGISMDIRDVKPKSKELTKSVEMPWSEWKKKGRFSGKNRRLYGRAGVPEIFNGEYDLEPALQDDDKEASEWWLNFALGALAETKTAIAASEVAENVGKGPKFEAFVKKAERKIFHKFKQQIVHQKMMHESTNLANLSPERGGPNIYGDYDEDYYGLSPSPSASPRGRRGMKQETALDETLRELEMPFEASVNASRKLAWRSDGSSDSDEGEDMMYDDGDSEMPMSRSRRSHRRNQASRRDLYASGNSRRQNRSRRRNRREIIDEEEFMMDSTFKQHSSGRRGGRSNMSETYRSSISKSGPGLRRMRTSPPDLSDSVRLPGSRGNNDNPRLYLTEGKMGDRYNSRGGRQLLPSSAREDLSTNRTDKTDTSANSSNRPNVASLRITNLTFASKSSLTKQIRMNGGKGNVSLKLIGLKKLNKKQKGKMIKLQVYSGDDELVYSTKEMKSDGTTSIMEWHDVTMASMKDGLRVDILSDNNAIGSILLDDDIVKNACHTQAVTTLKVFEVKKNEEDEDDNKKNKKRKQTVIGLIDIAMQTADSIKSFGTSMELRPKASNNIIKSRLVHSSFETNTKNQNYEMKFKDVLEINNLNLASSKIVNCVVKVIFGKDDNLSLVLNGTIEINDDNDSSNIVCKVNDGNNNLEGVVKFNLDIVKLTPRSSGSSSLAKQHSGNSDKLGSTLPPSRSTGGKKNRSRHRRVNTYQDDPTSSSSRQKGGGNAVNEDKENTQKKLQKKHGSSADLIDNINKLLVRYSKKYSKGKGKKKDNLRESLFKKFLAKEQNNDEMSSSSSSDSKRNINISFVAWVEVMYDILDAVDDNKILDKEQSDLSKAFARLTESGDLIREIDGKDQISVNAFLEYIKNL